MKKQHKNNIYPVSLSHFLSLSGVASRRKSTEIIKNGKVKVNDILTLNPGTKINQNDIITYDNKILKIEKKYYIALNKPKGYTCTADDPYAEKKILDLIEDFNDIRLFTVGRLDKNSEGLIIITNDGNYANKLMHPSNEIEKCYIVDIDKPISNKQLTELRAGIVDEDDFLKPLSIKHINKNSYKIILNEGKKREIRRIIQFASRKVVSLKRISIGNFLLENIELGKWKEMSKNEINLSLSII